MVTGSYASSARGTPRATNDLDIVIAPTRDQLRALLSQRIAMTFTEAVGFRCGPWPSGDGGLTDRIVSLRSTANNLL